VGAVVAALGDGAAEEGDAGAVEEVAPVAEVEDCPDVGAPVVAAPLFVAASEEHAAKSRAAQATTAASAGRRVR
jgi:hypothetical protein